MPALLHPILALLGAVAVAIDLKIAIDAISRHRMLNKKLEQMRSE